MGPVDEDVRRLAVMVAGGDLQAIGPLMDRLEETKDWRREHLFMDIGSATDAIRDINPRPFMARNLQRDVERLFWPEIQGRPVAETIAAIAAAAAMDDDLFTESSVGMPEAHPLMTQSEVLAQLQGIAIGLSDVERQQMAAVMSEGIITALGTEAATQEAP